MNDDLIITFAGEMPDVVNVNGEEYVRRAEVPPPPTPLELGDFVRVVREDGRGPRVGQMGCVVEAARGKISVTFEKAFPDEHHCSYGDVAHAKHGRWFWVLNGAWTDGTGTVLEKI